jgi:hypothetical protein
LSASNASRTTLLRQFLLWTRASWSARNVGPFTRRFIPMAKQTIYERSVPVGAERVTLRLFRANSGLLVERSLGQQDGRVLVQVLLLMSARELDQLDEFSAADEHRNALAVAYNELKTRAEAAFAGLAAD